MKLLILATIVGLTALAIFMRRSKKQGTSKPVEDSAPAKTVKREFKNEVNGRHHITKVFEDGHLVRQDLYGDYGAVFVTYFDAKGLPTRMQMWGQTIEPKPGGGMGYTYYLQQVSEYHPGTNVIKRSFIMDENGKLMWDCSHFDTTGKITSHQSFHGEGGTLSQEIFLDNEGKVTKTVPHTKEEGIRGEFSADALAWPDGLGDSTRTQ